MTECRLEKGIQPVVITLTLPSAAGCEGALLVQRGDLAHLSQFSYTTDTDFTTLIQQALAALGVVERDPPIVPDEPPRKTTTRTVAPSDPPESMLDIPTRTKKGTTAVPVSCLQIVGTETDDAAQSQALKVAGRLLDSGLWDGRTPICIREADTVWRRLDGLTDKELKVLFTLDEFVQIIPDTPDGVTLLQGTPQTGSDPEALSAVIR